MHGSWATVCHASVFRILSVGELSYNQKFIYVLLDSTAFLNVLISNGYT